MTVPPGAYDGIVAIDFHRDASTLESAIGSAIGNVVKAGFEVERVEIRAGGAADLSVASSSREHLVTT
jgi:hypothetical protein